ncbi:CBF/NF-Y family transcription factor [Penicillium taxi]|uniref:CBF/NF-Y family transcription factor n=1 Tax=Penicillium taxi TaxID=168475 RepID=UPI00254504C1|nr:CBF/NF-Y family transcription factor [Penicillium taxi]KAJ5893977.1 CBF/NF-Y family transcription factor [Penicillium taxi]
MPPRKSTSSVTPGDIDDSSMLSTQGQSTDKPITATEQQIKARAELGVSVDDYLLPRSLTIRLAKSVLPPNTTIQKDAVLAIQKAATVFVSYLASHANDATLKRTLNPSDVFSALSELEFDSFRERLEQELEAYSEIKAGKRKSKKSDGGEAAATSAEAAAPRDDDNDVEMAENPSKRVKRDSKGVAAAQDDGDETQEEELEDEAEEDEEEAEEDDDEEEDDGADERRVEYDVDRVEDLDARPRHVDPDADETDDDDGPASQLRDNMGLG